VFLSVDVIQYARTEMGAFTLSIILRVRQSLLLAMDSDDDDLQRAIRLSLQTERDDVAKRQVDVDLTEEGEELWPGFLDLDEMEFWKGIVMSMGKGTASSILLMTA
jgi:Ubiquitin interaction motif